VEALKKKIGRKPGVPSISRRGIMPNNAAALMVSMELRQAISIDAVGPDLLAKLEALRAALEASKPPL
jgi:hypothetical protein